MTETIPLAAYGTVQAEAGLPLPRLLKLEIQAKASQPEKYTFELLRCTAEGPATPRLAAQSSMS